MGRSEEFEKLIGSYLGVPQDFPKKTPANIVGPVGGDCYDAAIWVAEANVTAFLSHLQKTSTGQGTQDLTGSQ